MSKSIATFSHANTLPDHLKHGASLGNENVTADAMTLPRIDIVQALSPQKQKSSPKYIEGAKDGDIFNSLTGELYSSLFVVNLMFDQQYSVFKDRKFGAGFEGGFRSEAEAAAHLVEKQLDPRQYNVNLTHIHKCLLLDKDGHPKQPVLFYMNSSKLSVSSAWNTNLQLTGQGADRFSMVWTVTAMEVVNKQNQPYFNFKIDFAGFAGADLYKEAKLNYLALAGKSATEPATEQ